VTEPRARRGWSDHEVEQVVGRLLQVGVLLASAVVLAGGVMLLVRHGGEVPSLSVFRGAASHLRSVGGAFRGVLDGNARAIVQFGIVLLIATPVARVALTLGAFALQRDRLYVALTALVLVLLLYGLFA
jgi:uncharacterized membrane protein